MLVIQALFTMCNEPIQMYDLSSVAVTWLLLLLVVALLSQLLLLLLLTMVLVLLLLIIVSLWQAWLRMLVVWRWLVLWSWCQPSAQQFGGQGGRAGRRWRWLGGGLHAARGTQCRH